MACEQLCMCYARGLVTGLQHKMRQPRVLHPGDVSVERLGGCACYVDGVLDLLHGTEQLAPGNPDDIKLEYCPCNKAVEYTSVRIASDRTRTRRTTS